MKRRLNMGSVRDVMPDAQCSGPFTCCKRQPRLSR